MVTQKEVRKDSIPAVIDVDERTFQEAVLARSRELPVVVDFWAPWCAPCRALGPILERLAAEAAGAFVLAKINVDNNQRLAVTYRVQGLPTVKAFRDGQVVAEFSGAQPESRVRDWLKRLLPAPLDQLAEQAAALEQTDPQAAAARYRELLAQDADHPAALFGLGRLLVDQGDPEGAELLHRVPASAPQYTRARAWLTLAEFLALADEAEAAALDGPVGTNQSGLESRYRVAARRARERDYAEALAQLLEIVQRDRSFRDDGARRTLLALFDALGDQHPLVVEGRRKLANALF